MPAVEHSFSLSLPGLVLMGVLFLCMGAGAVWLVLRAQLERKQAVCNDREAELRESQKSIHEKERVFLEERNRIEITHADAIKQAKAEAHEQGRQLGKVEGKSQHLEEIMALKSEFAVRLTSEVDSAVSEARRRLTAEYELQSKLFTVQISPFVRISDNKGLFSSESVVETGYQYQLLVNGIPAFQPHEIIERSEAKKEVNDEKIKEYAHLAGDFASSAIEMYLGAGGGQFAKLAPAIIKKLGKK